MPVGWSVRRACSRRVSPSATLCLLAGHDQCEASSVGSGTHRGVGPGCRLRWSVDESRSAQGALCVNLGHSVIQRCVNLGRSVIQRCVNLGRSVIQWSVEESRHDNREQERRECWQVAS